MANSFPFSFTSWFPTPFVPSRHAVQDFTISTMSTTEVQLTVFLFGANLPARPEHLIQGGVARVDGIRVELELRPRMPARITNPMERNMWMQDLLARVGIVRDLKHSHDWGCTYCGMRHILFALTPSFMTLWHSLAKPARESTVQVGSWMNQNPPKMAIWVRRQSSLSLPLVGTQTRNSAGSVSLYYRSGALLDVQPSC